MGTNRYLIELCSCLYLNIMCKNVLLVYARSNPLPVVHCFKQGFCILHQSCFASSASILHLVTSFVTVHYLSLLWLLFPYICPYFLRAVFSLPLICFFMVNCLVAILTIIATFCKHMIYPCQLVLVP